MYWLNPHAACRLLAEFQGGRNRLASWIGRTLWRRFTAAGELAAGQWPRALPLFLTDYANSAYVLDLGADTAWKAPADAKGLGQIRRNLYRENGQLRLRDPWFGSIRGLGGIYADIVEPVIKSAGDLAAYRFNDLSDTAALRKFRRAHPDACLLAEVAGVQQALSDIMWRTDQFMLALYDHPAEIAAFQERLADWIIGLDPQRRGGRGGHHLHRRRLRLHRPAADLDENVAGVHLSAAQAAHRGRPRGRRAGHAPFVRLPDVLPGALRRGRAGHPAIVPTAGGQRLRRRCTRATATGSPSPPASTCSRANG